MPSTFNGLKSTVDALAALKARVEAVQWTPQAGPPEPAFQKVDFFDMTDLPTALQELFMFKNRVCLIVHDQETFDNEKSGQRVDCRQSRDLVLLISDRNYKLRKLAMMGDATTPGVFALKDLLLPAVVGLLQDGIYLQPGMGELMLLEGKKRDDLSARIAYRQDLQLKGGILQFDLGTKPVP